VNKSDINYIETDRESVVELKTEFYNYLNSTGKNTPELKILDVLNKDDFKNLYDYISIKKLENKNLDKITLLSE
jgi:hypothetical protein